MGRPKKDPAQVRSVPLNFRVSPGVKSAIDEMVRRHAVATGDDSITGWFIALVHREAAASRIPIGKAPQTPAATVPAGEAQGAPAATAAPLKGDTEDSSKGRGTAGMGLEAREPLATLIPDHTKKSPTEGAFLGAVAGDTKVSPRPASGRRAFPMLTGGMKVTPAPQVDRRRAEAAFAALQAADGAVREEARPLPAAKPAEGEPLPTRPNVPTTRRTVLVPAKRGGRE